MHDITDCCWRTRGMRGVRMTDRFLRRTCVRPSQCDVDVLPQPPPAPAAATRSRLQLLSTPAAPGVHQLAATTQSRPSRLQTRQVVAPTALLWFVVGFVVQILVQQIHDFSTADIVRYMQLCSHTSVTLSICCQWIFVLQKRCIFYTVLIQPSGCNTTTNVDLIWFGIRQLSQLSSSSECYFS